MVTVPKQRRTFCKGRACRKHTVHKISQYKKGKDRKYSQGRRRHVITDRTSNGQAMPVFLKKCKTTKKILLRLQCTECAHLHQLTMKRCRHFEVKSKDEREAHLPE